MKNFMANRAYVILATTEIEAVQTCTVRFDLACCSYGQPVLWWEEHEGHFCALGPADIRGGAVQHYGPHRAALEAAGYQVVDDIAALLRPATEAAHTEPIDPDGVPQEIY